MEKEEVQETEDVEVLNESEGFEGVLCLRGEVRRDERQLHWASDVIDNENMNKAKSKSCCIFHPSQEKESSEEESSDDSEGPNAYEKPVHKKGAK